MYDVAEILKTEYDITTMKELDDAIKRLGFIDVSLFCISNDVNKEVLS